MTHARRTPFAVGALAVGAMVLALVAGATAPADALSVPSVPKGATRVAVHTARTTTVDLALTDAGAIGGSVVDGSSQLPVAGATVTARDATGRQVGTTSTTRFDGGYTVLGLPRSAKGFAVCVMPKTVAGGPAYGYIGRCYRSSARFLGTTPPKDARYVPTVPGTTRTGIDLVTGPRGAIRTLVDASGVPSSALRSVTVRFYDSAGRLVATRTGHGGSAALTAPLPPGSYHVCVDARASQAAAGVLGRCYGSSVSWVPGRPLPDGARTVTVGYGTLSAVVHLALRRGGSIDGAVLTAAGRAIVGARVVAYRNEVPWGETRTNDAGGFLLRGLASGRIRVCSSGGHRAGSLAPYVPRCAPLVGLAPAKHVTGVDIGRAALTAPIGSISGTVVDGGGRALTDVRVDAFAGTRRVATTTTTTRGRYVLAGIRASGRGYSVCFSGTAAGPASNTARPATGYSNVCYGRDGGVRWSRASVPTRRTTLVTVAAGRIHRGIGATLGRGGSIRGRITYRGAPLAGTRVYVADANHRLVTLVSTDSAGRYRATGLTPSTLGYVVCAFGGATSSATTAGDLGYRGRCSGNVAWDVHKR